MADQPVDLPATHCVVRASKNTQDIGVDRAPKNGVRPSDVHELRLTDVRVLF
jgi:hypothetical protein